MCNSHLCSGIAAGGGIYKKYSHFLWRSEGDDGVENAETEMLSAKVTGLGQVKNRRGAGRVSMASAGRSALVDSITIPLT